MNASIMECIAKAEHVDTEIGITETVEVGSIFNLAGVLSAMVKSYESQGFKFNQAEMVQETPYIMVTDFSKKV